MGTKEIYRKKCRRYNIPGHAHELTFSCYRRQPLLKNPTYCDYLAQAITLAKGKHNFDLWAYVFMPEHIHLVIYPKVRDYSISSILQTIKQSVSRKAIRHLKQQNPVGLKELAAGQRAQQYHFWQAGGGYDRNIKSDHSVVNVIRYIHNNPVRRKLVGNPLQWHYSSALDWSGEGTGPVPIDFESYPVT